MEIPYFFLLILYLCLFLGYLVFAAFNVYHVVRFGFFDPTAKLMTFAYIFSVLAILAVTAILLVGVDWSQTIPFLLELS